MWFVHSSKFAFVIKLPILIQLLCSLHANILGDLATYVMREPRTEDNNIGIELTCPSCLDIATSIKSSKTAGKRECVSPNPLPTEYRGVKLIQVLQAMLNGRNTVDIWRDLGSWQFSGQVFDSVWSSAAEWFCECCIC